MSLSVSLRHRLPGLALDVSFQAEGGATVLFGRSGAGKTTVVNAVAGLLRPEEARIVADDMVLCDTGREIWVPPHRRRIGYIFQDARLFPHLTVRRNLAYGRRFLPRGERRADGFAQVVDMLGLGPLLDRRTAALSGGEQQRVAIGRALLSRPRLLLADEPLASLDAARKAEILPYFERLRDEAGIPILYVSHAVDEVARLAARVVVLQGGRVIRQGPAEEVLGDPDVRPLGARAAGALLPVRVVRHHDDGLTEVSAAGASLFLPRIPHGPGTELRVRIEASDVMLALRRPEDISALNVIPARIREIRAGTGPGALIQLEAAGGLLLARVTQRSVRALALAPGQPVFAVLKAVSVAKGAISPAG